ncbi:serine/threonine-protein kinase [Cerasibacillus quisquiliarum]|uniref:Putative serine/threonine-protein kinase YabT n=1 Tax=Cerasibacillus quisquiliarum TaxID=227865 RepID=A0A511V1R9_9BACI|nr:protein kinase [Cerasibacillus quisquiliarum]MBB5146593.1 serine/threonine-protein kinase [Cerasibacillus quisquiliarum]GEN31292.1 putative serine/threonine-protein kinase YabT [Cerasibacillus quisquiliarum]
MTLWKKHELFFRPGKKIIGKWQHHRYTIKRKLGSGAVGTVFLCHIGGREVALKISKHVSSIMTEVNVLKSLKKVQEHRLGPSLMDVDDFVIKDGTTYTFYVMEYIKGDHLRSFIRNHGTEWIGVFMLQLLDDLEKLHQRGWVLGDLKIENLIVENNPPKLRWIDVGGTTRIGRSIKEYTEIYDRGYWGLGSRKAEPSYDLFALVIVFLSVFHEKQLTKGRDAKTTLLKKLVETKALNLYEPILKKALLGQYPSSSLMKQDMLALLYHIQQRRRINTNKALWPFVLESLGISVIAGGLYLASIYFVP